MSAELIGAVKQLVVLLTRYFTPFGNPPIPQRWMYPLPTSTPRRVSKKESLGAVHHFFDIATGDSYVTRFSSLISTSPDPRITELFAGIPPLLAVSQALKDAEVQIRSAEGRATRLQYLFNKLCEREWSNCGEVSTTFEAGIPVSLQIGFDLTPIEEAFLSDFVSPAEEISDVQLPRIMELDKEERLIVEPLRTTRP